MNINSTRIPLFLTLTLAFSLALALAALGLVEAELGARRVRRGLERRGDLRVERGRRGLALLAAVLLLARETRRASRLHRGRRGLGRPGVAGVDDVQRLLAPALRHLLPALVLGRGSCGGRRRHVRLRSVGVGEALPCHRACVRSAVCALKKKRKKKGQSLRVPSGFLLERTVHTIFFLLFSASTRVFPSCIDTFRSSVFVSVSSVL